MENVKIEISLPKSLLAQVDALAQKMNVSRNRLFALAIEKFIQPHQNQLLLKETSIIYQGLSAPTIKTIDYGPDSLPPLNIEWAAPLIKQLVEQDGLSEKEAYRQVQLARQSLRRALDEVDAANPDLEPEEAQDLITEAIKQVKN